MSMIVIVVAAAAGITAVCLLERERKWNRVGGIAAIILGCILAVLLYYNATALPDTATLLLTVCLTSLLLVLVGVLVSLLCRKGAKGREKPEVPVLEKRTEAPKKNRRAAAEVPEYAEPAIALPPEIRWEAAVREPICIPAISQESAGEPIIQKEETAPKPRELRREATGEAAGKAESALVEELEQKADQTEGGTGEAERPEITETQEDALTGNPQEEQDFPSQETEEPVLPVLDRKQAEMDVLKELMGVKAYRSAMKQAFHILGGRYLLLPEEKEKLKVVLGLLKEKVRGNREM
ncbi:hypothetical protein [Christensenella minuta]|uniref:hypothetical protein n=1 Tax=Christensenella minuta TaxID=626937 RepID=UPI002157D04B|nr:hypothetical protein [Christensenella minuta]